MLLTIVFSNHCDLDCNYCCIGDKNTSPILDADAAIDFVEKYAEEENVLEFYGGEPTLHKDELFYIMEELTTWNVEFTFRLYTNGLFKDYSEDDLRRILHYTDEILLSLDGYTYDQNKDRFKDQEEFNQVLKNIDFLVKNKDVENEDISIGISSVLYGARKYENIENAFDYFSDKGVRYFSFEPMSVYNDDKPMLISLSHWEIFITNIYDVFIKAVQSGDEYEFFVAKEFLSTDWYKFDKCKSCSSIARAISPRGKVYMCRDFAANEERMFHSPSIVKFSNVNKLEINYDNFKSIANIENDLTPCVVKDMQYKEKYTKEDLYWLGPDFQDLIIKPLLSFIIWINSCEGEYPDELLNELQTYKDVIKDIFINLDKGLKC